MSLVSWLGYFLLTVVWLWYSIVTRDKPVILYSILGLIAEAVIVVGILMYS